jgi:Putative peptidoglycan binding domain
LREALAARSDDDFVATPARRNRAAPPRAGAGRSARGAKPIGLGARAAAFARRYPLEIAVSCGLAGTAFAIVWNALALQTARHPAPLFGTKGMKLEQQAPLPPTRPFFAPPDPLPAMSAPPIPLGPVMPAPATVPPPRPTGRDAIGDMIRTGTLQPGQTRPALQVVAPRTAPARDAIGDLIRLGEPPPIPPGYVGKPEPTRIVASGQRALARLNYLASKADGVMGPETRQAVERFERDRNMTVTGEFGPRTARELAAESGVPVE